MTTDRLKADRALSQEVLAHYAEGLEASRLLSNTGQLELARTKELISRFLPPAPASVMDVGGGAGVYSLWLAGQGYEVHLVDPVPLHIEQAIAASARQPESPIADCVLGDARELAMPDKSADALLLLGPLYHLTDHADRLAALAEAKRVLRPNGLLFAAGISRFASALDGLREGLLTDPEFVAIVKQDLVDGQHRNPNNHPGYFTTAFFHHPDELASEVRTAGFVLEGIFAVEGPAWLLQNLNEQWQDNVKRDQLLDAIRWLESEPSLLGASAHVIVVAR